MTTFQKVLTVGFILVLAAPALALDLNPPGWRGDVGTTMQQWEFKTDALTTLPDVMDNKYGGAEATVTPVAGSGWIAELEGEFGVWHLSGTIEAAIYNVPKPNDEKWIWVQLTWLPGEGTANTAPLVSEIENLPIREAEVIESAYVDASETWIHSTYLITLPFNPDHEKVLVSGDVYVSEMVIDTICVPEPGTFILAGLSLIGMFVALRKR